MTGTTWIKEGGFLEGPVLITNTHSVGVVRDASIAWRPEARRAAAAVVAARRRRDVRRHAERHQRLSREARTRDAGAGRRPRRAGRRGQRRRRHRDDLLPVQVRHRHRVAQVRRRRATTRSACWCRRITARARSCGSPACRSARDIPVDSRRVAAQQEPQEQGSIIIVVATDAPLLPHQLERVARRASLGLARTGATSGNGSGDIFIAFSTANAGARAPRRDVAPCRCSPTTASAPSSRRRCRRPRKRSSTRSSPQKQ